MKKFCLFLFSLMACVTLMQAQSCLYFFPSEEGTTLTTKTYDVSDNLEGTMTYRVLRTYNYFDDAEVEIGFQMTDKQGTIIDAGKMEARCDDGNFYLNMANRAFSSDVISLLGQNTQLIGSFLDYPDAFDTEYPFTGGFQMDGGEFSVVPKDDESKRIDVSMYNRYYDGNETVTTPAGEFNAAKVTFLVRVTQNRETTTYKGVEWYSVGAGIVRTEIYDDDDNLQTYTVLTELIKP